MAHDPLPWASPASPFPLRAILQVVAINGEGQRGGGGDAEASLPIEGLHDVGHLCCHKGLDG